MHIPSSTSHAAGPALTETQRGLICPHCGYDLRATTANRCPECGHAFDRQTLAVSHIPWVHRKELGHSRAWWRTLQLVTGSPRNLADEIALPVSWRHASNFRRITLYVVAALAGTLIAILAPWLDLDMFNLLRINMHGIPVWIYPTFALCTGPGFFAVTAVSVFTGGISVSWWVRLCIWIIARDREGRASALSCYLTAWMLPLIVLASADLIVTIFNDWRTSTWHGVISGGLIALNLAMPPTAAISAFLFFQRSTRSGPMRATVGALAIVAGGFVLLAVSSVATSYVMGLAAIVVKSLS